jgi:integrase
MKAYIRFTQAWLSSAASRGMEGRTVEYRDGGQAGLSLRVHPSGSRVFCVVGSIKGSGKSTTRVSLGNVDRISLPAAREDARKVLEAWALGREYETPAAEARRKEREKIEVKRAAARETKQHEHLHFERVLNAYGETHLLGTKSGKQVRDLLVRMFSTVWMGHRITDLKRSDVIAVFNAIADSGRVSTAKAALGALKGFIAWVHSRPEYNLLDAPACTDRVKFSALVAKARRPKPRERTLNDEELRIVWTAASSPKLAAPIGDLTKTLVLTGLRLRECALMGRSEISAEGWVTIPPVRMKAGKAHRIWLPATARAIINQEPIVGDFVFRKNGGPLRSFSSLKVQIDAVITEINGGVPLEPWCFHDLRRTARSRWSRLAAVEICELGLAHALPGGVIRNTYDRHRYEDELKLLFERWDRVLLGIVYPDGAANVVPLGHIVTAKA